MYNVYDSNIRAINIRQARKVGNKLEIEPFRRWPHHHQMIGIVLRDFSEIIDSKVQ